MSVVGFPASAGATSASRAGMGGAVVAPGVDALRCKVRFPDTSRDWRTWLWALRHECPPTGQQIFTFSVLLNVTPPEVNLG